MASKVRRAVHLGGQLCIIDEPDSSPARPLAADPAADDACGEMRPLRDGAPLPDCQNLLSAGIAQGAVRGGRICAGNVLPWNLFLRPHRAVSQQRKET